MTDTRERELRRMILAAPDDLAVRLVYADHLIERGDPRGDFIALDCAREHEDEAAELRRRALWQRHAADWMTADLGFDHRAFHWAREVDYLHGFVDHVTIGVPELLDREATLAQQPIRELSLMQLDGGGIDRLADSPVLDTVRSLTLSHDLDRVSTPSLARLLSSPRLARLEELEVSLARPSIALWSALERCPHLPRLARLGLTNVRAAPEAARWLAEHLPALETLHTLDSLDGPALLAFAASSRRRLSDLYVFDRTLDGGHVAELLDAPLLAELTSLSLVGPIAGARAIARLPCAPTLRLLRLSRHRDPEVIAAAASAGLARLESLDLCGNELADEHASVLGRFEALRHVDLGANELVDLSRILEHAPRLASLGVADCPIADDGVLAADARRLRTLDLACTRITARALDAIVELVDLRELDIDHHRLGADGIRRLAGAPLEKISRLTITNDPDAPVQGYFSRAWLPHWRSHGDTNVERLAFERRLT